MLLLILLSRCISFDSYIKPQLLYDGYGIILSCISFDSYIKPQLSDGCPSDTPVVYLLIPTSNHNWINSYKNIHEVVYLLIPTSNHNYILGIVILRGLYIFWFLHQTTTCGPSAAGWGGLYIFWFLHQTTTAMDGGFSTFGCISFDSYIKPQRSVILNNFFLCCISFDSYIKPQRRCYVGSTIICCISFDSYIKPQRFTNLS